ncbi:MAG: polysaccharide export protein [Pseudomonadota bacterium]|nr:polysaccharide export protein [Pseudomonadota bacterium]
MSVLFLLAVTLSGCADHRVGPLVGTGDRAYSVIPAPNGPPSAQSYQVGPLDNLDITVFQEPDISAKGIPVDAAGDIALPLIGKVHAAGRTPTELADFLSHQLQLKFYVNPQVTVIVTSSVSQSVTVEGQVTEPGIYQIRGPTTLLDAVALAKGESENAALRQVMVIRYIEGRRMGAVFDVKRIRSGFDKDPAILARDVIVVGHSTGKQAWHDLLRAAPLFNAFSQF